MSMKKKQVSLATLRAAKGLSQKEFAKKINVSPGLIGLYETGRRKPSLGKALLISQYFNIPLENISFETTKEQYERG